MNDATRTKTVKHASILIEKFKNYPLMTEKRIFKMKVIFRCKFLVNL